MTVEVWNTEQAKECLRTQTGFRIDEETGCYYWLEPSPQGYGPFLCFFEAMWGPVPAGMQVRWLCGSGQRGCVRPRHMEAVPEGTKIATVKDPATMLPGPTFAHRLILEREARGMRRDQFARELRVSSKTLHGWEDERHYPDVATLTWITRFLGWDGQRRRFAVTFLTQRIVEAESSGQALDRAWEEIERVTASPRKAVVISVKPVARRRAKVRG